METKALIFRTWDDLVFANRNKDYGAYPIRRAYFKRVTLGLGVSIGIVAFLLSLADVASRVNKKVKTKIVEPNVIVLKGFDPPVKHKDPPKKPNQVLEQTTRANTEILVVTTPVEPTETTQTNVSSPVETGEEGGIEGSVSTGTGTQVTDIPVVNANAILTNAEVMPTYKGGLEEMLKFIKRKIKYPATPRRLGIDGTVFVSFVVNGDGSVSDVSVLRGIHMACDEEAIRVISMLPGWIGGKQNGMPVRVRMVLPIKFNLEGSL